MHTDTLTRSHPRCSLQSAGQQEGGSALLPRLASVLNASVDASTALGTRGSTDGAAGGPGSAFQGNRSSAVRSSAGGTTESNAASAVVAAGTWVGWARQVQWRPGAGSSSSTPQARWLLLVPGGLQEGL